MAGLLHHVDPDGLLEFSVVYTDRSLNHMSKAFQNIMTDISETLKYTYNAEAVALIPGGGTYAMESVARQFAKGVDTLVIRNGWFSFRWSQIFDTCQLPSKVTVLKAIRQSDRYQSPFAPVDIKKAVATIQAEKPKVVFAPHVETASGIMLPDDYIKMLTDATHAVGGIFVLDCIASGAVWIDMKAFGVDVLISAPQKGWSSSPCCGMVMMNQTGLSALEHTQSSSFAADLKKWLDIMRAYEKGGHAYHATMPTDALADFHKVMMETKALGFNEMRDKQLELGQKIRVLMTEYGYQSVAADGFGAPGVVVSYTDDDGVHNGSKFADLGLQSAAGVPLQCDEPADFKTFRIGLFGLDKLKDVDATVTRLKTALDKI